MLLERLPMRETARDTWRDGTRDTVRDTARERLREWEETAAARFSFWNLMASSCTVVNRC
jgi:hypothetical protein